MNQTKVLPTELNARDPILITGAAPTPAQIDDAVATIKAIMHPTLLVLFGLHLEALAVERANGGLDVELNMHCGNVDAAKFLRRTHWLHPKRLKG